MPYLKLETNVAIPDAKAGVLLKELSAAAAKVTGKPEAIMMVGLAGGVRMLMAGSEEPAAFVQVKGIGFAEDKAKPMTEALCALLAGALGIPGKRVSVTYDSYKGSMWGMDGKTF